MVNKVVELPTHTEDPRLIEFAPVGIGDHDPVVAFNVEEAFAVGPRQIPVLNLDRGIAESQAQFNGKSIGVLLFDLIVGQRQALAQKLGQSLVDEKVKGLPMPWYVEIQCHSRSSGLWMACQARESWRRPWCRRDFTVPSGMPKRSAASRTSTWAS